MIKFSRISLVVFLFILLFGRIQANTEKEKFKDNIYSVIYLMAGFPFGYSADDFFTTHKNILGGKDKRIDASPIIGIGTKFYLNEKFRAGFSVDLFYSFYSDSYNDDIEMSTGGEKHFVIDDINIKTMPFILSLEAVPFDQQYNTYFGIGAGVSAGNLTWEEKVSSPVEWDRREGGVIFDEFLIKPAIRFYSGVELAFDKHEHDYFLGNLMIEIRYTYIFRGEKLFEEFKTQYHTQHPEFDESYNFIPFYLSLNVGVSFNFNKNVLVN